MCGNTFVANSGVHKNCSKECSRKWSPHKTTEEQYKNISGNWKRYFGRLLFKGRKGILTVEELLALLDKQGGLCALSGIPLTCTLEGGKRFPNNASIDRIEAGGTYEVYNVQLVCSAVNSFRRDVTVTEFIDYCKAVTAYQQKKES